MQRALIDAVVPGAVIAQDIYSQDGRMLISKGVQFRSAFMGRLVSAGIREICIEDDPLRADDPIEPQEPLDRLLQEVRIDDIIYEKTRRQAEHQVMKIMVRIGSMRQGDITRITQLVEAIIEQLLSKEDVVLSLSKLRSIDDYTYEHSVNVCVISLLIGTELHLERDALRELGIGAILHDIGKVGVDERIIKKPGRLTAEEFDRIKEHTELGYQILRSAGFSEDIARIALHHHERVDGSGYPQHLEGRTIPLFARTVAIADIYDAISNDRIYRRRMTPDQVYREILRTTSNHLDEALVEKFMRHIRMYPTGCGVLLNTGEKGVVIGQNRLMPESPLIRMIHREEGRAGFRMEDVDLSLHGGLFITGTF